MASEWAWLDAHPLSHVTLEGAVRVRPYADVQPTKPVRVVPVEDYDAMVRVLRDLLRRDERNTCQHEETKRQGLIWEVCCQCGERWSDDRNPRPEWQNPTEWEEAYRLLARMEPANAD